MRIITAQGRERWWAWLENDPSRDATGSSRAEAVGNLIMTHGFHILLNYNYQIYVADGKL